jgi:bla regulator protein blaR1
MMHAILESVGRMSLGLVWLPVLAWTVLASAGLLMLRYRNGLHPLLRYRMKQALLFALPATLLIGPAMPFGLDWTGQHGAAPLVEMAPSAPATAPFAAVDLLAQPREFQGLIPGTPDVETAPPSQVTAPEEETDALEEASGVVGAQRPSPASANNDSLIWFAGIATMVVLLLATGHLGMLLMRLHSLGRLARTSVRIGDAGAMQLLERTRERLGIRRPVALLAGPEDSVPITFGWHRPVIVIPTPMLDQPDQLRMTLLHELVHIKRADFMWALSERTVSALFAFHPLVWMLCTGIERDREASCDAEVVGIGEAAPQDYASLLYSLGGRSQPRLGVAAGLATPASHLKERIETMKTFLNQPATPRLRARSTFTAIAVLFATTLLGGCFSIHEEAAPEDEAWSELVVYDESGWPLSEEAIDAHVMRLDLQIAYLDNELDKIEVQIEAAREANGGSREVSAFSRKERIRYGLLTEMFEERLREYETMKLEQVAAAAMR